MEFPVCARTDEAGYCITAPDLDGCSATGPTVARALADLKLVIEGRLAELYGTGRPLPRPTTLERARAGDREADTAWFLIHINLVHLEAVAKHQAGRWA